MAANPPPADLETIGEQVSSEPGPTEFWRSILPWDDLNAKSPPGRWLEFQKDIIPTLAVLVAGRSPTSARLLTADARGRLVTAAMPLFADVPTALFNTGDGIIQVADQSLYSAGMALVFSDFGSGGPGFTQDYVCRVTGGGTPNAVGPGAIAVEPSAPQPIPAGTEFVVMAPLDSTLPPAPWHAPRNGIAAFRGNIAAGAAAILLAANAGTGLRHYLFGMHMSCSVAPAQGNLLEDTAGVALFEGSIAQDVDHNFAGASVVRTRGVQIRNATGGIIFFTVNLGFSTA